MVDVDPHRRVVAVGVDPHSTTASDVMTHNPTTVLTEDSAMEALGIMLGRHFRHLPVRERGAYREGGGGYRDCCRLLSWVR